MTGRHRSPGWLSAWSGIGRLLARVDEVADGLAVVLGAVGGGVGVAHQAATFSASTGSSSAFSRTGMIAPLNRSPICTCVRPGPLLAPAVNVSRIGPRGRTFANRAIRFASYDSPS